MSATLGSMLAILQPDWRVVLLERGPELAQESSAAWNNAGTGHSGYCELNYMPDAADAATPLRIVEQFQLTRRWWDYLVGRGWLQPDSFVHSTPHMTVVFGRDDVDYLRRRFQTLAMHPAFAGMQFSEDPATIAGWAPLVMDGRGAGEPIAATRITDGTDVDFGALTRSLARVVEASGGQIRLRHEVRTLRRASEGGWIVRGRNDDGRFQLHSRHVFVGAGGYALRLLQKAGIPEVRGYAVLPVGAAFLRCSAPQVVARHDAKVYSQAPVGAPPMSVPHLDKRIVDGAEYLLFGPYATFSTKLGKHGRWSDFFTTVNWTNLHVIAAAGLQNLTLLRYLIGQLMARPRTRFAQLQRFYATAAAPQWELIAAGQRAQLVTPDRRRIGVVQHGTELVTSADGSISGLLGASPGASTAVSIMRDLLQRCFPEQWNGAWRGVLDEAFPPAPPLMPAVGG